MCEFVQMLVIPIKIDIVIGRPKMIKLFAEKGTFTSDLLGKVGLSLV